MLQFSLKCEPENEYKHILVKIKSDLVICGFPCFTIYKGVVYEAEKFNESNNVLVDFKISGQEIFDNYTIVGDPSTVSFEDAHPSITEMIRRAIGVAVHEGAFSKDEGLAMNAELDRLIDGQKFSTLNSLK